MLLEIFWKVARNMIRNGQYFASLDICSFVVDKTKDHNWKIKSIAYYELAHAEAYIAKEKAKLSY